MPICHECGEEHPVEELELIFRRPDVVAELDEEERGRSVQENADLCILEGKQFFIRAILPLAVTGRNRPYNIGIWVAVTQASFERVYELWDEPSQGDEPPFSAVVANEIPTLPTTIGLEAMLCLTGTATRPEVVLCQAGHPLVAEQANGIAPHRAHEYSSLFPRSAA
jgi:hypothetical protein